MSELIGAIDQGTSSTRFMVFNQRAEIVAQSQKEHSQIFPKPGWVEHDLDEVWENTEEVITQALSEAGLEASDLTAVGITNQRETTAIWERSSGEPVSNAIVWQDTRTADLCSELSGDEGNERFKAKTGLPIATYFSGPKIKWMLDEFDLHDRAQRGELAFGTMDSWLAWNLTGRHMTDVTNASRTLLMDLATTSWDSDLALEMGVPTSMLPEIVPSVGELGTCSGVLEGVPLMCILGDQQAALFGQTCFQVGDVKNTYGTGNFILMNVGSDPVMSDSGLLTTVAYKIGDQAPQYALEGSIAVTGSLIQWLRDNLGLIDEAADVNDLASQVDDNGDVYFVPAFSGLFAPYWRQDARGVLVGLTRYANRSHVARAALEAAAYQTRDVVGAMETDSGKDLTVLKVDGGMAASELLMQFQADLLGSEVVRPMITETTVLGAAFGAGLAAGIWPDFESLRELWEEDKRWQPEMDEAEADRLYERWGQAVQRSFGWV